MRAPTVRAAAIVLTLLIVVPLVTFIAVVTHPALHNLALIGGLILAVVFVWWGAPEITAWFIWHIRQRRR